jgi:hypothetical protein
MNRDARVVNQRQGVSLALPSFVKRELALLLLLAAACTTSIRDELPPPWSEKALAENAVPALYAQEWQKAENRGTCALLAFRDVGEGKGATPRAAQFSGGWAVAYDTAETRSAFGIAGTGTNSSDPSYASWPHLIAWADGSTVGYGPEGGTGPNQLAYLRVSGQGCLYNVWSRLGREHLEHLLGQLRFVATNDLK